MCSSDLATTAGIQVTASDGILHLRVRDNGRGGADFSHGSGLIGLKDRAEALGGHFERTARREPAPRWT